MCVPVLCKTAQFLAMTGCTWIWKSHVQRQRQEARIIHWTRLNLHVHVVATPLLAPTYPLRMSMDANAKQALPIAFSTALGRTVLQSHHGKLTFPDWPVPAMTQFTALQELGQRERPKTCRTWVAAATCSAVMPAAPHLARGSAPASNSTSTHVGSPDAAARHRLLTLSGLLPWTAGSA